MLKLTVTAAALLALGASVAEASPLVSFSTPSAIKNKYHGSVYGSSCYSYEWAKFGDVSLVQSDMTNLVCANWCGANGYKFSGSQGSSCRCSAAAPTYSSALCLWSCPGDWSQTCGGLGSMDVWVNADIGASSSSSATKASFASSSISTSTSASTSNSTSSSTKTIATSSTSSSSSASSTSSTSSVKATSTTSSSSSMPSTSSASFSSTTSAAPSSSSLSSVASTSSSSSVPSPTYVASKYQATLYKGGCFYDAAGSGNPRTFGGDYTASGTSMTSKVCANYCGDKAFKYSGVEYGSECMCSNQAPTVTAGATCNMACSGNATETCGGLWSLTVFDNVAVKAPEASTLSSNYQSLGCFADQVGSHGRTLNSLTFNSPNMTIPTCTAKCSAEGYPYSGLEYADQCWCGQFKPLATSTACNMACSGNSADICGGPNALSVYYDSSLASKANPTPSCDSLPQGYAICKIGRDGTCAPIDG